MGRVAAPYAVKGWLKIQPFTDYVDSLFDYPAWWLRKAGSNGNWQAAQVLEGKVHGRFLLVQLDTVPDRNTAEQVVGWEIAVERAQLPEPEAGEYYWDQLIGLRVIGLAGVALGKVERILESGAHDILVVHGEREHLIPFVDPIVRQVDVARGQIEVDWGADY